MNAGASATQMLRRPCSLNAHPMRGARGAAVRIAGEWKAEDVIGGEDGCLTGRQGGYGDGRQRPRQGTGCSAGEESGAHAAHLTPYNQRDASGSGRRSCRRRTEGRAETRTGRTGCLVSRTSAPTGLTRWTIQTLPRPWRAASAKAVSIEASWCAAAALAWPSPRTRWRVSGRRRSATPLPRGCRANTTTSTCWQWARGPHRLRWPSEILRTFLDTPFEGGRHARRVEKIHLTERGA